MINRAGRESRLRSLPPSIGAPKLPLPFEPRGRGPDISELARAALTIFVAGASVGVAFGYAGVDNLPSLVLGNVIGSRERRVLLNEAALFGIAALVLSSVLLLRRPNHRGVAAVALCGDIVSPLTLAFAVPLLFRPELFQSNELLFVVFATLFGLLLERALRRSFGALQFVGINVGDRLGSVVFPKWLTVACVGGLALFFGLYFSYYTIQHHYQLQSRSFDLAIFDNMMWNLLRGAWFKATPVLGRVGSHLRYHATFDAYLFAPLYALRQRADTLLALQALFAGAGAIPIYLLVRRRLGSTFYGLVFAYAYVIHAPLHGPIFYDFHFLTTAPFWVGWVLYFFETRRNVWLAVAWLAAVLLREEVSACLAAACLFYLLSGRRPWLALWGGVASAACFLLIKFVIMPAHSPSGTEQGYAFIFGGLIPAGETGFGAVLRTVGSNPVFTLNTLLSSDKLAYLLKTLAPVLLLPLRNARAWVLLLPAAIFTLLSTGYPPVIQTYFQYTSNWTSFLFFAAAVTLGDWRAGIDGNRRVAAAVVAIAVTATAVSYNYGAIFQHSNFRGGFTQVNFFWNDEFRRQRDDLYALIAMIPKDASVAATETEAPHVSNRENCFTMRANVEDPDYLLANLDEVAGGGEAREKMLAQIKTGAFGFMGVRSRFVLWGKKHSHDRDVEGKALLHMSE
jgi:uncharacterized membrane protein